MAKPNNIQDYIGKRYGRWIILAEGIPQKFGKYYHKYVKAKCDCGTESNIGLSMLKTGNSTSCGCFGREWSSKNATTHGLCMKDGERSREYTIWTKMKYRCLNPNSKDYAHYGGRGITVCDRWKNSFPNFIADMGYRPSSDYSIERIKVNEGYNPDNCKWIPKREQPKNTRVTKLIEHNGEKLDLTDWCKKLNLNYHMMRHRVNDLKFDFSEAIKYPKGVKLKKRLNL